MGSSPTNFVSSLNCVLAQRRRALLCSVCKAPYQPTDEELIESGLNPNEHRERPSNERRCDACNTRATAAERPYTSFEHVGNIREMITSDRPARKSAARPRRGASLLARGSIGRKFSGILDSARDKPRQRRRGSEDARPGGGEQLARVKREADGSWQEAGQKVNSAALRSDTDRRGVRFSQPLPLPSASRCCQTVRNYYYARRVS